MFNTILHSSIAHSLLLTLTLSVSIFLALCLSVSLCKQPWLESVRMRMQT